MKKITYMSNFILTLLAQQESPLKNFEKSIKQESSLDLNKGILSSASVLMPKNTPKDGWVEHNPDDFLNSRLLY